MKFTFPPEAKPLDGYTIKRAIDRGGFGEVYYAHSDSGKEVALKLLQRSMDIELRGLRQCLNLKHTNLITIFDIKIDGDGEYWVVMEFVAGKNLEQTLQEYPDGLPMPQVRQWLEGIARGAAFLHDRGVVHRDLKPANVFLDGDVVKIGDVGLSKFITPSRRSGHTESVGTVYYMAPEVAHGRYGKEVDVYSVAIMLCEMLTGKVPIDGETKGEILMKHLTEKPDLSGLPMSLRPVLARALEKDPLKRTGSVTQLVAEFEAALRPENVAAKIPAEVFLQTDNRHNGVQASLDEPQKVEETRKAESNHKPASKHQHPPQDTSTQEQQHAGDGWGTFAKTLGFIVAVFVLMQAFRSGFVGASFRLLSSTITIAVLAYAVYWLAKYCASAGFWTQSSKAGSVAPSYPREESVGDHEHTTARQSRGFAKSARHQFKSARSHTPYRNGHLHPLSPLTIRPIALRQRLINMTMSMTLAVIFALPIAAIIALLTPAMVDAGAIGLFALTTIAGAWAVLVPTKLWEGTSTDSYVRRLTLLICGCLVGGFAFLIDQALLVDLTFTSLFRNPSAPPESIFASIGHQHLLADNAQPTLAGYMTFFAALFVLRRWWWLADAFRPKRFRVRTLLVTSIFALLITLVWAFPQGWAVLWGLAISAVVQLASTWIPAEARPSMVEET